MLRLPESLWLICEPQTNQASDSTKIITLANPIIEACKDILVPSTNIEASKIIRSFDQDFASTYKTRITDHAFRYSKLVSEYPDWYHFRSSWLQRNDQNVTRRSVPSLVSHDKNNQQSLIKQFIPDTKEFYTFRIKHTKSNQANEIDKDLISLIEQEYASRSSTIT